MAINLKPIKTEQLTFTIRGISPMIQHSWSEKAKIQMRDKHAGKKTKTREIRDPEAEAEAAAYRTDEGDHGIPAMAFKSSLITAAHKDIGIEKTLLRKALFVHCEDSGGVLGMDASDPIMREDCVRVGAGSTDLRYRPEFREWAVTITCTFDAELLRVEDIINLVNRAGFGCGIGEWRPEKGGEYGRYEVDTTMPVETSAPVREAA
jgi:hypothetical protein